LKGQRDDLERRIEQVRQDYERLDDLEEEVSEIGHLMNAAELILRDNDPEWDPDHVEGLKPWTHHIPIPFGQCGRRGHKALREANKPLNVRQVAKIVLTEAGVPEPEKEILRRVQNAIEASFRKFDGRTVESSGAYPKQWRAINKPEIEFDP